MMDAIWQAIEGFLRRSPHLSLLMKRMGIDPVHYWLLVDLFGALSDRRELPGHLGHTDMSLQKSSWMFYFLSGLMVLFFVLAGMSPTTYIVVFLLLSGFLLFTTLLSEANNSLVNPVEGIVLAHQPINGATYTSAKLTHILRVLLYLVPALNLIPAFAGLLLAGAPWYYPLLHLAAAFTEGIVLALACCALFGWLIRFVPPARLKAFGFAAEMSSWLLYLFSQFLPRLQLKLRAPHWLPAGAGPLIAIASALAAFSAAMIFLGLRSLSGDYLVRVSAIAHGGSAKKYRPRRSRLGAAAASLFGGPNARAGFDYVWCMMTRDWQFRRQLINLIPITAMACAAAWQGVRISPFSGRFTAAHVFPHALGFAFFVTCSAMPYGLDRNGAWVFLLTPIGALRGLARGVYARLLTLILAPELILLPVLAWQWGIRDATLFLAYSAAASAVYLAVELRLLEGVPFTRQADGVGNPFTLMILLGGGLVVAIAVGLQYFLIFRSPTVVLAVTAVLAIAAWLVTRGSLETFEVGMRFHLGLLSTESKGIYTEVNN
jgi:hypothetical protein